MSYALPHSSYLSGRAVGPITRDVYLVICAADPLVGTGCRGSLESSDLVHLEERKHRQYAPVIRIRRRQAELPHDTSHVLLHCAFGHK